MSCVILTSLRSQDLMHVLLEGSVQYEVRFILQHFFDSGILTLRQLNNAWSCFRLSILRPRCIICMIHIPHQILHLGPLVRHCCMRFEARHRYFKDLAPLQNFKNICLSLAERYQLDDCANFCNDNPSHHPLFETETEKELGPTKKLVRNTLTVFHQRMNDAGLLLNPEMLDQVYSTKFTDQALWYKICNKQKLHNCC